jgi:hypothetical protein
MKRNMALLALALASLTACDTMNRPLNSSGDFDPLRPPGSGSNLAAASAVAFSAGQFVHASMDKTAFFKNKPNGDADADKLLSRGTSMKVISTSGSFLKVELDSGEVGFVPTVMVEDPKALPGSSTTNPGEFQVYPPLGPGVAPLPQVTPAEQPPGEAIPTIIDPEAPASTAPIAPVKPMPETFPATEEPKPSAPLPPNEDDIKKGGKAAEATPKIER